MNRSPLYPNPAQDFVNVQADINLNSVRTSIIDANGRVVDEQLIKDNRIDVAHLSTGTYFLSIQINGQRYQTQFVKQ